jgi:serine/threonine protein kinase
MAKLNHANIATVFDSAEDDGKPYMVMELVHGPTLLELVKATPLTLPQVCTIRYADLQCAEVRARPRGDPSRPDASQHHDQRSR